jgi:hypothetical protein
MVPFRPVTVQMRKKKENIENQLKKKEEKKSEKSTKSGS